jgi:hypothetical protein
MVMKTNTAMKYLGVLLAVLLVAGCVTEQKARRPGVQGEHIVMSDSGDIHIPPGPDNPHANVDSLTDPCAARMHALEGAMLFYYAVHHKMPEKLEDLKGSQDFDQELAFTCPKSNEPYGYVPGGLAAPGKQMRIVVYDASPVHNGFRWCVMVSPSKPGSITVDVIPLAESVFRNYHADQ